MTERTPVRAALNCCGAISARVADVIALKDDPQLVGVADVVFDSRREVAVEA